MSYWAPIGITAPDAFHWSAAMGSFKMIGWGVRPWVHSLPVRLLAGEAEWVRGMRDGIALGHTFDQVIPQREGGVMGASKESSHTHLPCLSGFRGFLCSCSTFRSGKSLLRGVLSPNVWWKSNSTHAPRDSDTRMLDLCEPVVEARAMAFAFISSSFALRSASSSASSLSLCVCVCLFVFLKSFPLYLCLIFFSIVQLYELVVYIASPPLCGRAHAPCVACVVSGFSYVFPSRSDLLPEFLQPPPPFPSSPLYPVLLTFATHFAFPSLSIPSLDKYDTHAYVHTVLSLALLALCFPIFLQFPFLCPFPLAVLPCSGADVVSFLCMGGCPLPIEKRAFPCVHLTSEIRKSGRVSAATGASFPVCLTHIHTVRVCSCACVCILDCLQTGLVLRFH
eukprot:RCo017104